MGFKKIDSTELKTKITQNLIGVPIRYVEASAEQVVKRKSQHVENHSKIVTSDIIIEDEATLQYRFSHDGHKKTVEGTGSVSIINTSNKDRVWDAGIEFGKNDLNNLDAGSRINLGVIEPQTSRMIKYAAVNTELVPDLLPINERIEVTSGKISSSRGDKGRNDAGEMNALLLEHENVVTFIIDVQNNSDAVMHDVKIRKYISRLFHDFKYENGGSVVEMHAAGNFIEWTIGDMSPKFTVNVSVSARITPTSREPIKSGNIEASCSLEGNLPTSMDLKQFSACSLANHKIVKEEKETEPNHWACLLSFTNQSDFMLEIKSIEITMPDTKDKVINVNASSSSRIQVAPGASHVTKPWECESTMEPSFERKIKYSVLFKEVHHSLIAVACDEITFSIVGIELSESLSQEEVKSFESTKIYNTVQVKNTSEMSISKLIARQVIPCGLLPVNKNIDIFVTKASEIVDQSIINVIITPDNEDSKEDHVLEIIIGNIESKFDFSFDADQTIEIKYPVFAVAPDYKNVYKFPLEITCYFGQGESVENKSFVLLKETLADKEQAALSVVHRRRKVSVEKEIFPGRTSNEFAISIIVKNESDAEITDMKVEDKIPNVFELVSSNSVEELVTTEKEDMLALSITIPTLEPYEEKTIEYYIKNNGDAQITNSDLESYLIG
ncbi:MAG TPA: hypothetical protein VKM55_24470 [Candidatus Lokiarchaeia archaeon]|nr:hypothetical protein [Candidatus Lokiarchaeia archaeon]